MNLPPITLLVMTDGRSTIHDAIASFEAQVEGNVVRKVIHDDSGNVNTRNRLQRRYPDHEVIYGGARRGFGGAIHYAWEVLLGDGDSDYVFHLEDDFTFNRKLDIDQMAYVLDGHPNVVQMALRRQSVGHEQAAGSDVLDNRGITAVEQVEAWEQCTEAQGMTGFEWLEHRLYFTTNPSLYRASLMDRGWPAIPNSEGHFSIKLFDEDPLNRSGYWGSWDKGREWVRHIGDVRNGTGY